MAIYSRYLPQQVQRLPDGSRIGLLGYTYGATHRFVLGSPWQRMLHDALPEPLRASLKLPEYYRMGRAPGSIVLWVTRSGASPALGFHDRLTTVDENGQELTVFENRAAGAYGVSGMLPAGSSLGVQPIAVDTFPRRGAAVRVRIYRQSEGGRSAAEFRIPNPDPGPHGTWTPAPPGARQHKDDFTFALTSFETGGSPPFPGLPVGAVPWTCATFEVLRAGRPAPDWYADEVRVQDATGNDWDPLGGGERGTAVKHAYFRGSLSTAEVYRLKVEFTSDADFPPRRRWTLLGVPIPPRGKSVSLDRTRTDDGYSVRLERVDGPGMPMFSFGNDRYGGAALRFRVLPAQFSPQRLTLLAVSDDRGRSVLLNDRASESSPPDDVAFELEQRPGLERVNLVVGVRKSYYLEFLARPTLAAPGGGR